MELGIASKQEEFLHADLEKYCIGRGVGTGREDSGAKNFTLNRYKKKFLPIDKELYYRYLLP